MAYRPMDPTMDTTGPPEKTIRSHEQNQERAFIAASRRSDRGIEARLQSARRASEVHKLRTGKGLCVSRDIVLKEEMYEEMDDGFPRSYQLRGPHQRRSSASTGAQGARDPKSPTAMAELDSGQEQQLHENEVNREFAQYFPQVNQILSRRWSTQSIFTASPDGFQNPPRDNYAQCVRPGCHSRSLTDSSTPELRKEADVTPPTLATEFGSYPPTPQSQAASGFTQAMPTESLRGCNPNSDESAFAANLPPEINLLLADGDVVDPALYDQQWMCGAESSDAYAMDMDLDEGAFSELFEDGLNSMSWDLASQQKASTDDYPWNRNMFQNGNVRE